MNEKATKAIDRAIITLVCGFPFEATIIMRLKRLESEAVPTMGTDGRRLLYNPEFVLALSPNELVAVLAHECHHVAGLHMYRRGSREPMRWNIACDMVVNAVVQDSNLTLPGEGHKFKCTQPVWDKTPEELYEKIETTKCFVSCGGIDDPKSGEDKDGQGGRALSKAEMEVQAAETKQWVAQAAESARQAGKLTAGLARLVGETLESIVPWRELLARFVSTHSRSDYSWARPNRRHLARGFVLPGLWSEELTPVIMACDTSGSIDQDMLRRICSELIACMELYVGAGQDVDLQVLWCDAKCYPQLVSDPRELKPQGGGGTSYVPVFEWVDKEGEDVRGVVYVTDGYCGDFGEEPDGTDVLWVLTAPNSDFKPPFGEIAHVMHE